MPPQIPPLAQSESKQKFLERLSIPGDEERGRRIYAMMKEEAAAGRARMSADPTSLVPQLRGDPSVRPPYGNVQISETAMHRETLRIYRQARPETKPYYDLGHDTDGINEENWVIKWLLWHVFRYRDNRNRSSRANAAQSSPESNVLIKFGARPPKLSSSGKCYTRSKRPALRLLQQFHQHPLERLRKPTVASVSEFAESVRSFRQEAVVIGQRRRHRSVPTRGSTAGRRLDCFDSGRCPPQGGAGLPSCREVNAPSATPMRSENDLPEVHRHEINLEDPSRDEPLLYLPDTRGSAETVR
ncbi:hypothetical protein M8818_001926 [Zalaria obscura]|uniref:Uncharacterized protein n=1 Tax=Zalaria obscura TaxID=2024903 RepID=A0ACC3SJ43_9PEZI